MIELHKQVFVNDCCLSYLSNLSSDIFDVVITSPPYNINMNYSDYKDNKTDEQYLLWINKVFVQIYRVLKESGSIFLNIGSKASNPVFYQKIIQELSSIFKVQNEIIWVKSLHIDGEKTFGHFKPINSNKYINNTHEFIYHLVKQEVTINKTAVGVPYTDKSNLKRWNKEDMRCRGNVWFIPYPTKNKSTNHPASFPELLSDMCIKLVKNQSNLHILDPFAGSGTVAVSSYKNACTSVNIEIDKLYHKESIFRLNKCAEGIKWN